MLYADRKDLDVIKTTEELINELERAESEVQILKGDNTWIYEITFQP